jgi:hypothetical protein
MKLKAQAATTTMAIANSAAATFDIAVLAKAS